MKSSISLLFIFVTFITQSFSQGTIKGKMEGAVLNEVSGLEVVQSIYPEAVAVEKGKEVWFKVVGADKKVLGYCLSSKPYTDSIIGYHNSTPVIIVIDKKKVIQKVAILSNWETPFFIKKLEKQKYFNTWDGLKVGDALKKKAAVDSYSGATISARALSKNVVIILDRAVKKSSNNE